MGDFFKKTILKHPTTSCSHIQAVLRNCRIPIEATAYHNTFSPVKKNISKNSEHLLSGSLLREFGLGRFALQAICEE